jgi:hypothetical protein
VETWLDEVIGPLQDFVSLMTDRPNQVEEVALVSSDREPPLQLLYVPKSVELPEQPAHSFEFPSTAERLGMHFQHATNHWLELQSALGPALDLYFSTVYRRSIHLENRFLNIAGAAEAYHRRVVPPDPANTRRDSTGCLRPRAGATRDGSSED